MKARMAIFALAVLLITGATFEVRAITYEEKMQAISNAVKMYNDRRRAERETHNEEVRRTGQGHLWHDLQDPTELPPEERNLYPKAWDENGDLIYDQTSSTGYVGDKYRGDPPPSQPPDTPTPDDPPGTTIPDTRPPADNPPGPTVPDTRPPVPEPPVTVPPPSSATITPRQEITRDDLRKIIKANSLPGQIRQVIDLFMRVRREKVPKGKIE